MRGDLDVLTALALASVVLVREFDVESLDRVIDPFDAGEFLPDVDAVVIGNLDVAAGQLDVSIRARGALAVSGGLGGLHGLG